MGLCGSKKNKAIGVEEIPVEEVDDGNFFNNIIGKNIDEDSEANQFAIRQKRKKQEMGLVLEGMSSLFAQPVGEVKKDNVNNSDSDSESESQDSEEIPIEKEVIVRSKQFKRPS